MFGSARPTQTGIAKPLGRLPNSAESAVGGSTAVERKKPGSLTDRWWASVRQRGRGCTAKDFSSNRGLKPLRDFTAKRERYRRRVLREAVLRCCVCVGVGVFAVIRAPSCVADGNLLSNGDFESGSVLPWRGGAWGNEPELSQCSAALDRKIRHGGKASLRLCGRRAYFCSETVPVTPNALYKLGGWLRCSGAEKAALHLIRRGADGRSLDEEITAESISGDRDWTYADVVFDSGEAQSVLVWLWLPGARTGTAWFDQISL